MEKAAGAEIVHILPATANEPQILPPFDRAADEGVPHGALWLSVGAARVEHRFDDRDVAGAPADVAGQHFADTIGVAVRLLAQERMRGRDHAGGAEAALHRVVPP